MPEIATYKCLAQRFPVLNEELTGLRVLALRLRAPTELIDVLHTLGVDPVNMPMGDVYSSLAKGVIDGVVAPPDSLCALHLMVCPAPEWIGLPVTQPPTPQHVDDVAGPIDSRA